MKQELNTAKAVEEPKVPDFEVMYKNEHLKALKLEAQLLNIRFGQVQTEIDETEKDQTEKDQTEKDQIG